MNDPSNICLSCGLCCDGTLVGFVHVDREEIPALRALKDIDDENDDGFFLLPCDKLSCDGCTIYSNRPKKCRSFNCGLLNSVLNESVKIDSAIESINEAKVKKEAIQDQLSTLQIDLQSKSFYFKMLELKKLLTKNSSVLSPQHQQILKDIDELDILFSKEFGVSLS